MPNCWAALDLSTANSQSTAQSTDLGSQSTGGLARCGLLSTGLTRFVYIKLIAIINKNIHISIQKSHTGTSLRGPCPKNSGHSGKMRTRKRNDSDLVRYVQNNVHASACPGRTIYTNAN